MMQMIIEMKKVIVRKKIGPNGQQMFLTFQIFNNIGDISNLAI